MNLKPNRALTLKTVAGLILAAGGGMLLAWLVLPRQEAPVPLAPPAPALAANGVASTGSAPAALPTQPSAAQGQAANASFEELMRRQAEHRAKAAEALKQAQSLGVDPKTGQASSGHPAPGAMREYGKAEENQRRKLQQLTELQRKTIEEIQSIPPNDTKRMLAAVAKFDAAMQAAGMPSVINLEQLRVTMEASNRMQQLSRELTAEADKGKNADAARMSSLSREIQSLQKSTTGSIVKHDALARLTQP